MGSAFSSIIAHKTYESVVKLAYFRKIINDFTYVYIDALDHGSVDFHCSRGFGSMIVRQFGPFRDLCSNDWMGLDIFADKPEFFQSLKPAQAQSIRAIIIRAVVVLNIVLWSLKRPMRGCTGEISKEWTL